MNMFRKQPLWSGVRPRQSVRADRVIQKLSHLHSNASLPILPLSLPRSRARLPSPGPVVKVTQHAPRWRADRRAGRAGRGGGGGSLCLYCTGATMCRRGAGPRVVADCGRIPGKRAAELIFQHAAAPTSGPGEGDLPCLTERLLKWGSWSTPCRTPPIFPDSDASAAVSTPPLEA